MDYMDLSGYELESLRADVDFSLYRARHPGNPVSVLTLVAARSASRSIARLEREYALAPVLDSHWAAQPIALSLHNSLPTLVLDDSGFEPLDRMLGRPLKTTRFLRIALNLTIAVGHMHRSGLIHKDIKPGNVLVDGDDNIRLTGFGIASQVPQERQPPTSPEFRSPVALPPMASGWIRHQIEAVTRAPSAAPLPRYGRNHTLTS